jgi:hypothetical protein
MSYNSELQNNNADLQNILNTINELPDAGGGGTASDNAVLYTAQALTDAQKAQARENIGAGSVAEINTAVENSLAEAKASGEFDGEKGDTGVGITSVEQIITSNEDGGTNLIKVTLSNGTSSQFPIKNGNKGSKGDDGHTPVITADPTTDGTWIAVDGEDVCFIPNGGDGADGVGIYSIVRTSGDGSAGTTDIYTITFTNSLTSTFTVYNGKDGVKGDKGDKPVKGTDYFTDADIAEIVDAVYAKVADGNGVSY